MNPNSQLSKKPASRKVRRVDILTTTQFSGPLPHPVILEGYERVLPGMADRVLSMAEEQAKHRRDIESQVIRANTKAELVGIVVTFLITIACIGGSIYLIATDKQVVGFLTMVSTLLALVYNFYSGNRSEKETVKKMNKEDEARSADKEPKL